MAKGLNVGNLKQILVQQTTVSSGSQLGTYDVQRYSSVAGMVQAVGSLTIQCRFGVSSSSFLVSSSFTANSGGSIFSLSNFGLLANFQILAASSQQAVISELDRKQAKIAQAKNR